LPAGGIILDGFPRTVQQAERLDRVLSAMSLAGPLVLHLDVSRELLLNRLTSRRQCASCGAIFNLASRPSRGGERCEVDGGFLVQRDDDTEAVIRRRLREFDLACAPLVEHYSKADYHRVDGNGDSETVSAALLAVIGPVKSRAAA
jgi:adenylate kinase